MNASPSGDLGAILADHSPLMRDLVDRAEELRLQVLVRVVRGRGGAGRHTERWAFRAGAEYFYPASTVKLLAAIAALLKIQDLRRRGNAVTIDTPMVIHPLAAGQPFESADPSNRSAGCITVGHEIRKLFLVSDNPAFNRLYDFVGPDTINACAQEGGLSSVVIRHRLSDPRHIDDQRRTARVDMLTDRGVLRLPATSSTRDPRATPTQAGLSVGRAVLRDGRLVAGPMDFSTKNAATLDDLQRMLMMVTRPDLVEARPAFRLSDQHRWFLLDAMSQTPGESSNPRYSRREYPDDYGKFLLPGLLQGTHTAHLCICNKVGQAYGFTIENAMVTREPGGCTVFAAACIYTNANGVLNDDRYEYQQIAFPFMAELGAIIAEQWLVPAY